jgi:hypothetical protein
MPDSDHHTAIESVKWKGFVDGDAIEKIMTHVSMSV